MKDEVISSKDNARLKAARQVRDGRDRTMVFVEGLRLAGEALRSELAIGECFITENFSENTQGTEILALVEDRNVPVSLCSEAAFRSIADTTNPQGIILVADRPADDFRERLLSSVNPALLVYCFEISDPSNLGALLRTAEAAGVSGVVLSPNSTDPFAPKALRASMGAAFRVPIMAGVDITGLQELAAENGASMLAAVAESGEYHFEADLRKAVVIVLGGEANGLPADVVEACDAKIRIPMQSGVESLNLAVSGAIILYEAVRQRMN
ncbi:MAG TPA: RNA methyltransferase [Pyrinomonadaceae bacterium]|nr:RNA methyltransferase [Pyrinomonadaceae bacterium]